MTHGSLILLHVDKTRDDSMVRDQIGQGAENITGKASHPGIIMALLFHVPK